MLGSLDEKYETKLMNDIGCISKSRFKSTANLKAGLFDGQIPESSLSVEEREGQSLSLESFTSKPSFYSFRICLDLKGSF